MLSNDINPLKMILIKHVTTQNEEVIKACAQLKSISTPWTTLGSTYEECLKSFYGDYKEILVATNNNDTLGFLTLQTYGSFKGYIQTICVAEAFQRQSIGTQLIQAAEAYVFATLSPHMFICASLFNEAALALYKKLGYIEIGVLKDYIVKGYDEVLLKKSISSYKDFTPG
jgi:[ribosomal protein S18]-alanine N-acetyltransferase